MSKFAIRVQSLVSLTAIAAFAVGCSSSSTTPSTSTPKDSGTNTPVDSGNNEPVDSGNNTPVDAGGIDLDAAGSIETGTVDGGGTVAEECTTQSACGGSTPICCGELNVTGSGTNCNFVSLTSACASTCATENFASSGCSAQPVKICTQTSDCSDQSSSGNTSCCTFPPAEDGGSPLTFCFNSLYAAFGGATCK